MNYFKGLLFYLFDFILTTDRTDCTDDLDKNQKNTLLQSVAYGPQAVFMALRLKASFHASPVAIMALLTKHSLHQSKNLGFQPKKHNFFHGTERNLGL